MKNKDDDIVLIAVDRATRLKIKKLAVMAELSMKDYMASLVGYEKPKDK